MCSIPKENLGKATTLNESKYVELLKSALSEIEDSYRTLINNIISDMCLMFRCVVNETDTSADKVDKLMAFFDSLDDSLTIYVRDPLVKAFLLRAVVQPDLGGLLVFVPVANAAKARSLRNPKDSLRIP